MSEYRRRLMAVISDADFDEITGELLRLAKAGERWARKLLLSSTCGKPTQPHRNERYGVDSRE